MKKILFLGALAVAAMSLTGCDDFLNDNRYPLSQQTVNSEFWSNSVNVQNQINRFYNDYAGYGNRSSTDGSFYFNFCGDDQCGRNNAVYWRNTTSSDNQSSWTSPYTQIRGANLVIQGVENSSMLEKDKANFFGLARLHRARNYFELVRRYGDVPLVLEPLDLNSEAELYGTRTPRNQVMDQVIADLDYAIANISTASGNTEFSADLACAVKLEVCLFEGAYARYHQNDNARATSMFQQAVAAGEAIADRYPIYNDYHALYNSFSEARDNTVAITSIPEIIFCKEYSEGVFMHSLMDYSNASDGVAGLTKDAFDSFLFLDGKPAASTSYNNTDEGVAEGNTISIANLLQVRDQRLSAITYPYVMTIDTRLSTSNTEGMQSRSGYGVYKFNNFDVTSDVQQANKNYICAPLYWGGRLYCGILEAKAELGTLTDADLTKYMKPLWDRAGFTVAPTLALLNANSPSNKMNVSSLIFEIRRLRRCELMMDDDIRYWDLVRWRQLELAAYDKNADITMGANIKNMPATVTMTTGTIGNYLDCTFGYVRRWEDRQYFYPVPSQQIGLNPNLTQNPGW